MMRTTQLESAQAAHWLRRIIAASALVAAVFRATFAPAAITLDANFDSGSLCLVPSAACDDTGVASSVSGNTVTLIGRDNFNNGSWKWIYFRASGVNSQLVTFEIGDDFNTGASSLNNHRMVYSYDQQNWFFFDNNFRTSSQNKFTFANNAAFTQDSVYVAYGQPYPYQRTADHTASLIGNPWVTKTTSGDANFIVGQSPGGTDDIGRTITPHNLYGYKVTDPNQAGPKKKIAILGGVHANETLGNFTLEGLVNFLVSDELAAGQLRRYAEFFVYPMANPDGRFAGNNRTTVQVNDIDPNRAWNPPTYVEPGDTSTLDDIRQVGQAMRIDTGQNIDYLIDFHSTVNPSIPYHHGLVLPEWQSDPFWLALRGREPAVLTGGASLTDFTGAKFGRDVLNAEFSATFETVFPVNETVPRYLSLGRNFGLAWHDVFYVQGDLDYDGALDGDDWSLFIAGAEQNMTGLSAIERYNLGDLTGDGKNSFADFTLFKELYDQANGQGAFYAMLASVPEPGCAVMGIVVGSVAMCCAGNRQRRRQVKQD